MAEDPPTRSAALALVDERGVMRQGYEFLDEKRVLLAAEILRRLRDYDEREKEFLRALRSARDALARAVARHGLENLQVYPPRLPGPAAPARRRSLFLGVPLLALSFEAAPGAPAFAPLDPSPEADECQKAFLQLLEHIAMLAAESGNLRRLAAEYRRTEKRARALENVLLPEIEERLKRINEHLEVFDQEEAIRARLAGERRG
ncbi:MAG: V-type ATP synthase subunit D [Rhodomicrobiaceae bacterium]